MIIFNDVFEDYLPKKKKETPHDVAVRLANNVIEKIEKRMAEEEKEKSKN